MGPFVLMGKGYSLFHLHTSDVITYEVGWMDGWKDGWILMVELGSVLLVAA